MRRDHLIDEALGFGSIPGRYETAAAIRAEFGDMVADAYLRASARTGVVLWPLWPAPAMGVGWVATFDAILVHPDSNRARIVVADDA